MLELKGITKHYLTGDNTVHALNGIDLKFRKSEFVSILGPSGCGKTTTLNIIGGLDQYSSGDLIINGRSTKDFKDRDWDAYRNHSIGFVFQSYNLIPHQTVLQNVELALTLSGVLKDERRKRAIKALEDVGLGNQINKKPSEMSGGQMQRVAIARALVNDPDIILADEPTGALDTKTSVQVMDILKNISKDRLIIMVTHNPEIAEEYSSRIIRMLDGKITEDSSPLTDEEYEKELSDARSDEKTSGKKEKKPSMSFGTSFSLSLKNLFTKKGRTTLTSFAGSIGIIGIALVMAVSQGFSTYIDTVQEDALSSYPLTIESTSTDLGSLMETFMNIHNSEIDHEKDAVYKKSAVYEIIDALSNIEQTENDLKSFKKYIDAEYTDENSDLNQALNGVQYSYNLDLQVYTKSIDDKIIKSDTAALLQDLFSSYMGMDMTAMSSFGPSSLMSSSQSSGMNSMAKKLWQEMLSGEDGKPVNDLIDKQYDLVYGSWPNSYDEVVLILDKNNELDDMSLYALGLETEEHVKEIMDAAMNGKELDMDSKKWTYEDICSSEFRVILNPDCYSYDASTGKYNDLRETEAGIKYLYDNALKLKVTGVIRPDEKSDVTMLTGSIGYTKALTEYVIENSENADVIKKQLENQDYDVLTGLPFEESSGEISDADKETAFREYASKLDSEKQKELYISMMSIPDDEFVEQSVASSMSMMKPEDMKNTVIQALSYQMGMGEDEIRSYISTMSDEDLKNIFIQMTTEQIKMQYAQQVQTQMAAMTPDEISAGFKQKIESMTTSDCVSYYDELMEFSDTTYEDNLLKMGYVDLEDPFTINIYASTFENKDLITDKIAEYNENVDEVSKIQYTDYVGLMMSSVTTIINTITYVLIAFVAISLIVSSIMIGVITLISVQERTKEIGILRAIGASKKNVSSLFNAETMIIGFTSGLLGVLVTYLLCIPINIVVHKITGIAALSAFLPVEAAVILVAISVLLTLIAGIIPSRSAAKKDPVVALRTE